MEFVDGKNLPEMIPIQKTQMPIEYAIQIGEALQKTHSKGIKPSSLPNASKEKIKGKK